MGLCSSKDMAVCFVLFNSANTKRILMNYLYVRERLELEDIPTFTIELVFDKPQVKDAFHVKGSSHMFHKERLYRLLEQKIPNKYTKLAFFDADLIYDDPSWYDRTSMLLDRFDVVQMFETAHWLDLGYTQTELSRKTVCLMPEKEYSWKYHPGFAWGMTRKWYNKVGFFDWAVSGSGDTLSTAAWLGKTFSPKFQSLPPSIKQAYTEFLEKEKPKITYLRGINIYHLYHGTRANRQYVERHKMLNIIEDIRNLISTNKDGVYEWKNPTFNTMFLEYFKSRQDDDTTEDISKTIKTS
jgi:hypothetical protein